MLENGAPVASLADSMISAEAYLGAEPIVAALRDRRARSSSRGGSPTRRCSWRR